MEICNVSRVDFRVLNTVRRSMGRTHEDAEDESTLIRIIIRNDFLVHASGGSNLRTGVKKVVQVERPDLTVLYRKRISVGFIFAAVGKHRSLVKQCAAVERI